MCSIVLFFYNTILYSFGQLFDEVGFDGFFRLAQALTRDFAFDPWQEVGHPCVNAGQIWSSAASAPVRMKLEYCD